MLVTLVFLALNGLVGWYLAAVWGRWWSLLLSVVVVVFVSLVTSIIKSKIDGSFPPTALYLLVGLGAAIWGYISGRRRRVG